MPRPCRLRIDLFHDDRFYWEARHDDNADWANLIVIVTQSPKGRGVIDLYRMAGEPRENRRCHAAVKSGTTNRMPETGDRLFTLTKRIAAAYLGANEVATTAVAGLIRDIHRSLAPLEPAGITEPAARRPQLSSSTPPSVEIWKSVFADHLVCLEDVQNVALLKRHLMTAHKMTPEHYRARWSLPATYPMGRPITPRSVPGWRRKPAWARGHVEEMRQSCRRRAKRTMSSH